jgi:transposase-like protein
LARELGIRRNQLYKWKEAIDREGGDAFPGSGRRSSGRSDTEIARLRRELAQAMQENMPQMGGGVGPREIVDPADDIVNFPP